MGAVPSLYSASQRKRKGNEGSTLNVLLSKRESLYENCVESHLSTLNPQRPTRLDSRVFVSVSLSSLKRKKHRD